jgi:ubiquinone/menaquinone biosynthesis C-methylase UbiE
MGDPDVPDLAPGMDVNRRAHSGLKVSTNDRHHDDVMEHYRKLASDYGSRANRTCAQTYFRLVKEYLGTRRSLLEVGSGGDDLLDRLGSPFAVACDLSLEMLRARSSRQVSQCVAAAGETLPFRDGLFDGLFLINVLEHVADVEAVLGECARVLQDDGIWLAITPNGNWESMLDLAERWSLKIPEGPHRFLTPEKLRLSVEKRFDVLEHRTFLVIPAGPPSVAAFLDRVTFCNTLGGGFFQFVVAKKRRTRQVSHDTR